MAAFQKGKSGNPGGRPKECAEVKALARSFGAEAIAKLAELMRGEDARVAKAAADALLDRGYGKPLQAVEQTTTVVNAPPEEMTDEQLQAELSAG